MPSRKPSRKSSIEDIPAPWMYPIHDPSLPRGVSVSDESRVHDNRGSGERSNAGKVVTLPQIMKVYDRLPRDVRRALDASHLPWAPHWAERVLERGWPPAAVIERLQMADQDEAYDRKVRLLRGEG